LEKILQFFFGRGETLVFASLCGSHFLSRFTRKLQTKFSTLSQKRSTEDFTT